MGQFAVMNQNFCPNCGSEIQFKQAEICPKCGVRIKEPPKPIGEKYAGFWIRLVAYIIDSIILLIIAFGIGFIYGIFLAISYPEFSDYSFSRPQSIGFMIFLYIIIIVIQWIYFAYQESSSKQATIGKQALGLIVTDHNGNQLSFSKATGRWLAKILSGLILGVGLLMIGFTEKKQGLHDMIANTYVIYKER